MTVGLIFPALPGVTDARAKFRWSWARLVVEPQRLIAAIAADLLLGAIAFARRRTSHGGTSGSA